MGTIQLLRPHPQPMKTAHTTLLRDLYYRQKIASLGTLHEGHPFVSMVPFAVVPNSASLVIHVSQLAAHTRDMKLSPRVSVMIIASPDSEKPPQALARITLQGNALQYNDAEPEYQEASNCYLERFPESLAMFGFSDFSLFKIQPTQARLIGGFAQARTLSAEQLVEHLCASLGG